MRRGRGVLEPAAADEDESQRRQLAVRNALPADPPAVTSRGHVPANADVDEALQPSEGLARIRVPDVVHPPRPQRMAHADAVLWTTRRSSRREVFPPAVTLLVSGLRWEARAGALPATGALPFHAVEAEAIEAIGHARHVGLVAVDGHIQPRGDRLPGGQDRLRASATSPPGSVAPRCSGSPRLGHR